MRIKTYLVDTLSEAVERIKRDLGPEAVILSTRRPQNANWWKPGQPKLEVTAALDHGQDAVAPQTDQTIQYFNRVTEDKIEPLRQEMALLKQVLGDRLGEGSEIKASIKKSVHQSETAKKITTQGNSETYSDSPKLMDDQSEELVALSRELLWHYMDPNVVQALVEESMTQANEGLDLKEWVAEWIVRNLPPVMSESQFLSEKKAVAFVGPTGAGKTTSLVKLASHLVLEKKMKIAFITLDHYKVGGEEHLRHYAGILGVPCTLAKNTAELKRALRRFEGMDLVLVDTCGRSPNDMEGLAWLASLIEESKIETVMVVPANLRGDDLNRIIASYSLLDPFSLIMTKLDETSQYGSLFNASFSMDTPLAYFAMGQNVPEDFESASIERVLDCLLNFSGIFPAVVNQDQSAATISGGLQ